MLWLAALALAGDMTVVLDGDVTHATITCDKEVFERDFTPRRSGTHSFTIGIRPGRECSVAVTKRIGTFEQLGEWRCEDSGCVRTSADEAPLISAGPGQITILIASEVPHTQFELTCPSGYRERVDIVDFRATFSGVPAEPCTLLFKNGPPMKANDLHAGKAYRCHVVSSTPVCREQ